MEPGTKGKIRSAASWLVIVGVGVGGWVAYGSEPAQRALGRRETSRTVPLAPRPDYSSATFAQVLEVVGNVEDSVVSVSSTATVDNASQRARIVTSVAATNVNLSGQPVASVAVVGEPSPIAAPTTEIVALDATYTSGATEVDPWTRSVREPFLAGTWLDPYLIPTYDDVIGFELEAMPAWDPLDPGSTPATPFETAPDRAPTNVPEAVVRLMRWSLDVGTFRRASPVAYSMAFSTGTLDVPDSTPVTFTFGFDETGLLQYLDVGISTVAAASGLETEDETWPWFEWWVVSMSNDPATIDLPVDVIDAAPTA